MCTLQAAHSFSTVAKRSRDEDPEVTDRVDKDNGRVLKWIRDDTLDEFGYPRKSQGELDLITIALPENHVG